MIEDDPLGVWRICEQLSIVQAGYLAMGIDPRLLTDPRTSKELKGCETLEQLNTLEVIVQALALAVSASPERFAASVKFGELPPFKFGTMNVTGTTVSVPALCKWLDSRGFRPEFFFPTEKYRVLEFLDPNHVHFSDELAFAVKAWRALATSHSPKKSPKASIRTWIEANLSMWDGKNPPSIEAKERIATVLNWEKSGGAPASSG
ncbi:MAG: hypothetical protein ABIO62_08205 [Paracoccaceae bacterium]